MELYNNLIVFIISFFKYLDMIECFHTFSFDWLQNITNNIMPWFSILKKAIHLMSQDNIINTVKNGTNRMRDICVCQEQKSLYNVTQCNRLNPTNKIFLLTIQAQNNNQGQHNTIQLQYVINSSPTNNNETKSNNSELANTKKFNPK